MIYYREICRLAELNPPVSSSELLGYVIAHEIGHLLLGPQHQDGSVMKSHWRAADVEMIRRRELHFNRSQNVAKHGRRRSVEGLLLSSSRRENPGSFTVR